MKRSFFTLMVFTSLTTFPALAKDITVDSKISAATVYSDRADLTRKAKVEIPAGKHNLVFTGLPVSLYPDSLRTKGSSRATVIFGALSHKRESHQDFVVPKEKELNKQLTDLRDQVKLAQVEKQALQVSKKFIENLGKQASLRSNEEIAELKLNTDDWAGAVDVITMKIHENLKASQMVDIKTRGLNEKITKIQRELRELRTGQKQTYSVTIPFEADKETTLSIDLSYQLPSVSWKPLYDARLDVKSASLELVQYGSVWQRTGEDWSDIELTLSTAQPSRGAGLPNLITNWISIYKKNRGVSPAYREAVEQKNESDLDRAFGGSSIPVPVMIAKTRLEIPESKDARFRAAKINTDGFVGEYKITGLASVKADGTHAKLLVGSFETENKLQVQIKPQISTDAYLVVKSTLKGDAPILPGQVNLFRDGAYIGKSHIPMLRPDDEQNLAFGIDDNVVVKRNILKDEHSESGLISKEEAVEKHFTTEVKNLHKNVIEIAVLETVPVSQDKRLRSEILKDKTTAGYKVDVDNIKGLYEWSQKLEPQKETKINLGWKVSYPKGENVSGL